MANPNHLDNFTFNITLDSPPAESTAFSNVLMIVELATNSLNGDRARSYNSPAAMQTDVDDGYLAAAIKAAGDVAFAQSPKPPSVIVANWDRVGVETAAALATAIDNTGFDYWGVCAPTLRTDAGADSAFLEGLADEYKEGVRRKHFCVQSADAELLTTGAPTTDTAFAGMFADTAVTKRAQVIYHSDDTEYADVAYLANRLAFDADEFSVPWDTPLESVTPYVTATTPITLSDTQKGFLDANNINHGLELGTELFFVDPGVTLDGTPVYEVLTRDWFLDRLEARLAALKNSMSKRGLKITIDGKGQGLILALVEGLFDAGSTLTSPHFEPGQTQIIALDITQADRDAQRLRFQGAATFAVSARKFTFNLNFTRQQIITT